jgi:tetratricopeptide (TPR) repeat protein
MEYSPDLQNPYLGWRMMLAAFVGCSKKEARHCLELFAVLDNPEMQHLYQIIVDNMPDYPQSRSLFIKELWKHCKKSPDNCELLKAYSYACITWVNQDDIITRFGYLWKIRKLMSYALDLPVPNYEAVSIILEQFTKINKSILTQLWFFLNRDKLKDSHITSCAIAIYYVNIHKPKKILEWLPDNWKQLPNISFYEIFSYVYGYQALGNYSEAKRIFEEALDSVPFNRTRGPDTAACILYMYAIEERWEDCKELQKKCNFKNTDLCAYSEEFYLLAIQLMKS